jgi:hypothetical protein
MITVLSGVLTLTGYSKEARKSAGLHVYAKGGNAFGMQKKD